MARFNKINMQIRYKEDERVFVKIKPESRDNFKKKAVDLGYSSMLTLLEDLSKVSANKLKEVLTN